MKNLILNIIRKHAQMEMSGSKQLSKLCRFYLFYYGIPEGDFEKNGEANLVRTYARTAHEPVVFDVGSNHGEWALTAAKHMPDARIHTFEIAPQTYELGEKALGSHSNIVTNPFGLGSEDGAVRLYFRPHNDTLSTTIPNIEIHEGMEEPEIVDARVESGDNYCQRAGIDHIGLLKIDVEGAEGHVLDGFAAMLARQAIGVIQFEYGMANIYSEILLHSLYERLVPHGYQIGRLSRHGVDFAEYKWTMENFTGPNYVAVHSSNSVLIDALRAH